MASKEWGEPAPAHMMTKYADIFLEAVRAKDDDCRVAKKNKHGDVVVICWDGETFRVRLHVRKGETALIHLDKLAYEEVE